MLASILEKVYVSKTDEEKIKSLIEEHNKSKNCDEVTVQHCNQDIWNINLSFLQHSADKTL